LCQTAHKKLGDTLSVWGGIGGGNVEFFNRDGYREKERKDKVQFRLKWRREPKISGSFGRRGAQNKVSSET